MSLVNESQAATINNMFLAKLGRSPTPQELANASSMVATHSWDDIGAAISSRASQSFAGAEQIQASFLGGLGGAIKGAATGLVTGGIGGMVTGAIGGAVKGSGGLPGGRPPTISMPGTGTGLVGGTIGGMVGGLIPRIPGLTGTSSTGCGCNGSNGRDPCTRQKTSSQGAPLATFFGGCCPPGRTLRRVNNGRDICAKTARMNVFNPKALARADRRVTGFARRAAPILRDLGFQVSTASRKPKGLKVKRRRR